MSALACDDRSPSSRPVSPPSPSPAPQRIDSKRRPPALTLLVSNLTTEPPSSKRDAGSMEELRDTPSQPPKSLPKPTSRQANPFQNIPLPWSLVPTSSVSPTSLLQYQDASPPSPRFLPSHILATCQSESKRLTSELDRLTRKYAKLVEQRDETLRQIQLEPAAVVRIARTLEKQISRCDRVARQMYVCNDQIRQMECQMAEHRVGVWRVGREGRQGEENREGRRDEGGKQIGRDWGRTGPNEGEDRGGRSQTTAEHISAEALDFEGELSPNVILILPPRQYMAEDDVPDPSTPVDHHTAPLRIKPLRSDRCRSMIETSRAPRVKQAVRESRWDTVSCICLGYADESLSLFCSAWRRRISGLVHRICIQLVRSEASSAS